jgi:hypothetical protein
MTEAERNAKILSLKDGGMSYLEIAKTLYPNETDHNVTTDRIKKIVKRERTRLEGGDK